MRTRFMSCLVFIMLCGSATVQPAARNYYLALGDSLAIGVESVGGVHEPTNNGYADDIYAQLSSCATYATETGFFCHFSY